MDSINGRTGLTASYDWFSYTKPDGSTTTTNNNNNTSNNVGSFSSTQKYSLIASHSGKALDVSYGSKDNGANVLQYRYSGYENQKWYLVNLNNGYYKIQSAASGKALDVSGRSTADNANVLLWGYSGAANQLWKITPVQ